MMGFMDLLFVPTLGPLHIKQPRYNAVTLVEITREFGPDGVLIASYSDEGLREGVWREDEELGLFFLLPWAEEASVEVFGVAEGVEELRGEAERFRDYLAEMPRGREYLEEEARWRAPLEELLSLELSPEVWRDGAVLRRVEEYLAKVRERFGEGPATGFLSRRVEMIWRRLGSLPEGRYAVWVDLLDLPELLAAFPGARLPGPRAPTEAEEARAILDRAWVLEEGDDPAGLLHELARVGGTEAAYLAAQIYLASGQVQDALALLEESAAEVPAFPEYLPGYLLARLGQLRDLVGKRELAMQAYRRVMELPWAPADAREVARAGLRAPFRVGYSS